MVGTLSYYQQHSMSWQLYWHVLACISSLTGFENKAWMTPVRVTRIWLTIEIAWGIFENLMNVTGLMYLFFYSVRSREKNPNTPVKDMIPVTYIRISKFHHRISMVTEILVEFTGIIQYSTYVQTVRTSFTTCDPIHKHAGWANTCTLKTSVVVTNASPVLFFRQ